MRLCSAEGFLPSPVTIAIAGGLWLLGVLMGYAWGKRKAIMDMLKNAPKELKAAMSNQDDDKEDEEEHDEEKQREDELNEFLNEFFNRQASPGLDDHPQAVINPIMMLHIRNKKAQIRRQIMIEKLLAAQNYEEGYLESLQPDERNKLAEDLLESEGGRVEGGVGSVAGKVRRWGSSVNSTRILVDAGASLVPGSSGKDDDIGAEERLAMELRDKIKQIDGFLSKHHDIDVARAEGGQARKRKSDGKRLKDALTVANETKNAPWAPSHVVLTFDEQRDFAQRGRARVAPPLDHKGTKDTAQVRQAGRRASVGAAAALEDAFKEAKALEEADAQAMKALDA
jgi:hypothetical protein